MLSLRVTTTRLAGTRISLDAPRVTIGRQDDCTVYLDDPTVSRKHAVVETGAGGTTLRDLGSINGTSLNGMPVMGLARLQAGDRVTFGRVEALVEPGREWSTPAGVHVGSQGAGQINNVEGIQYIQHIRAERESFLADIAATKTTARRLVAFGFVCIVTGFALFGFGVVSFIQRVPEVDIDTPESQIPSPFGPDVGGVPLGIIGFALFATGMFTLIAGIVKHVSAAARLRRMNSNGMGY
ncbi:FHA domain-containing protein [Paractinoplanes lichenicola]|uniref:FHA domain-containing protein n=1 Tax=Paractinoplanes lichenicola TaxID=2802976 RepID=A0ABS1VSQ0_9ACTN|nr:FHA domain-containing protein [Actinoplanes lichenicola]MBL7257502.1 FHA domain-containing protein [Actinoplanes lichenicola]